VLLHGHPTREAGCGVVKAHNHPGGSGKEDVRERERDDDGRLAMSKKLVSERKYRASKRCRKRRARTCFDVACVGGRARRISASVRI